MYNIQNADTITEMRESINASISEGFPQKVKDDIQPVININPKDYRSINVVKHANNSTTGSTTIYTTSATKDFYLCGLYLQAYDDASSDNTNTYITITLNGATPVILNFRKPTLTLFSDSKYMWFDKPIKLDRSSNITISNSFTVGSSQKSGVVFGFETDRR